MVELAADDRQLEWAIGGDRDAFERVMHTLLPTVFGYIRHRVYALPDAEDILQETMLAAWQGIGRFDRRCAPTTWVIGIARRKIADAYRRCYRLPESTPLDEIAELLPAEGCDADEHIDLQTALTGLTVAERELAYLVFAADLPYSEVARVLEVPVGTVKSRMSSLRCKLAARLK